MKASNKDRDSRKQRAPHPGRFNFQNEYNRRRKPLLWR
jgi:rRNA maturation protein Nop10